MCEPCAEGGRIVTGSGGSVLFVSGRVDTEPNSSRKLRSVFVPDEKYDAILFPSALVDVMEENEDTQRRRSHAKEIVDLWLVEEEGLVLPKNTTATIDDNENEECPRVGSSELLQGVAARSDYESLWCGGCIGRSWCAVHKVGGRLSRAEWRRGRRYPVYRLSYDQANGGAKVGEGVAAQIVVAVCKERAAAEARSRSRAVCASRGPTLAMASLSSRAFVTSVSIRRATRTRRRAVPRPQERCIWACTSGCSARRSRRQRDRLGRSRRSNEFYERRPPRLGVGGDS